MRKFLSAAALLAIVAGASASMAEPLPAPNSCVWAPVAAGADGTVEHCEFVAADAPAHGYIGAVPNDFVIYQDANDNDTPDDGEVLVSASPTEDFGLTSGGTLDLVAGTTYSVDLHHGCVQDPGCGWVGALIVG